MATTERLALREKTGYADGRMGSASGSATTGLAGDCP